MLCKMVDGAKKVCMQKLLVCSHVLPPNPLLAKDALRFDLCSYISVKNDFTYINEIELNIVGICQC